MTDDDKRYPVIKMGRADIKPLVREFGEIMGADRQERRQVELSGNTPHEYAVVDSIACTMRGLFPLANDPLRRTRVSLETMGTLPDGIEGPLKSWGYTRDHAILRLRRVWAGVLIDRKKLDRDTARERAIRANVFIADLDMMRGAS
jgi:hypothetical protein